MEYGEKVFRHGRILGVEETGTSQNTFPPFGRRMIQKFHSSGRNFTATFGLDLSRSNAWPPHARWGVSLRIVSTDSPCSHWQSFSGNKMTMGDLKPRGEDRRVTQCFYQMFYYPNAGSFGYKASNFFNHSSNRLHSCLMTSKPISIAASEPCIGLS